MFVSILCLIAIDKLLLFLDYIYDRGVSDKGVGGIELRLSCMALSAEGHVHCAVANELQLLGLVNTEGEARVGGALLADRLELLDFLGSRDELQDVLEAVSFEGSVKGRNYDNFSNVGSLF